MSEITKPTYQHLAKKSTRYGNNTILVINDNTDSLELNSFILEQAGYNVLTAENGLVGLETAQQEFPDLIISDVLMPGLDGIELCHRLRAISQLKEIPVILVSAFQKDTENAVEGLEAGADEYLEVPFEPMRLIAKVSRLLERKRAEEERNRFFNVSIDMLCIAGTDGYFKRLNPAWEKTFGFTAEEFMSKPFIEFVHQEDREKTYSIISDLEKGIPTFSFENRYLCKDGSYKCLSWNGAAADENQLIFAVARDVSQAKAEEKILSESKEQITNILESITDGFFALDIDCNFTYLNPAAERMWQRSSEELLGKNIWEEFPAARDTTFYSLYKEVLDKKISANFTEFYQPFNFWLDVQAYPAKDGISVYFRDITELKIAEMEKAHLITQVEQQRERLNNIIANVPGIVWESNFVGDDGAVRQSGFVSDYVQTMTGYSVENWLETPDFWLQLVHPDDKDEVRQNSQGFFTNGESHTQQYRWICKDGKIIWVETQMILIPDETEKSFIIRGVTTDITERKEAETAIAEANERAICEYERLLDRVAQLAESLGTARDLLTIYRALYSFAILSVPCTGFVISLYEEGNIRLAYYVRSDGEEVDISTFPPMEMSGSPNSRAISTGTVIIENDFQAAMMDKPIFNIGLGTQPDVSQSCLVAPMSVMGRIAGAVEVQTNELAAYTKEHATAMQMAANLTANAIENVRLLEKERGREEQLRLSQKLESVGRLAGGIAHDFNNMLTAINGYSDLTLRRLDADDPLRRNVEEIKKAGERSAELTHQLLAFSRQQVLKPEVLNLNEVIIDISRMLSRLIGEDFHLNIVPESNLGFVEADPGQLTQVIMNLVVNARDAMPEGGNLTITTNNVYLNAEYAKSHIPTRIGSYVLLAVRDNGTGMTEEIKNQIFEPFYTTKKTGKGTGLGLATVYGIVKQSGGYIWVDSEIDKGTTFNVYLPRVDEENVTSSENKLSEIVQSGTEIILLVEDEDLVRNMSRQILEACGYQVIEARNGVEALNIYESKAKKIDLLLTDVVMPQMGGHELMERLARIHPEIRVLFTSGYTDDAIVRQGIIREDINFIQKPFTFDALAHKVRETLDNKKLTL